MRGVILAGGSGSRLSPLTDPTNKHLLPVARKPMIYHPIERLVASGIEDILVVTGPGHMGDIVRCLGSGGAFGCHFTYRVQDAAGGIAQALGLAQDFCRDDLMCVILGDNMFTGSLVDHVKAFDLQGAGAKVLLKENTELHRFGVAAVDGFGNVVNIVEKPTKEEILEIRANFQEAKFYVITGIYFYDPSVFDIISKLTPSARGELEISDVNRAYLSSGDLTHAVLYGGWTDAGTHESLYAANLMMSGV